MKQLKVEFVERAPEKHERQHDVEKVITATLDVFFFDGKDWFPYTAKNENYITDRITPDEVEMLLGIAEKHMWRWLGDTLREGSVDVNTQKVKIYAVAAKPITEPKS